MRQHQFFSQCDTNERAWEQFTHALGDAFFEVQNLNPGLVKTGEAEYAPKLETPAAKSLRERRIHNRWLSLVARLAIIIEVCRDRSLGKHLPKMTLVLSMVARQNIADPDVRKAIQDVVHE